MLRLESYLKEWAREGIITENQAQKIRDYESSRPDSSWVVSGVLILGALIIGLGIISAIAANWNEIPDMVKLGVDFIVLSLCAGFTFKSWQDHKENQFEVFLLLFMILCLASIGLISQVFHTGGKLYQALMFWSLISFPVVLVSRKFFAPFIWLGAFLFSLACTAVESPTFKPLFREDLHAVTLATVILCLGLTIVSKRAFGEGSVTQATRVGSIIAGFIGIIIAEVERRSGGSGEIISYVPGLIFAVLVAGGVWVSTEYRRMQKALLLAILAVFVLSFVLGCWDLGNSFSRAMFTIVILSSGALYLASIKHRGFFQAILVLLGIRFLILYFQALGGLAATGLGLIISGIIIIVVANVTNKYRKSITTWAEGITDDRI